MGYRLPTFNLTCNITSPGLGGYSEIPGPPYRLTDVPCQLTYGRRVQVASTGGTTTVGVLAVSMNVLLPKGTDVRGPQDFGVPDQLECPAGSGRWYNVIFVDDIAKGFSNEHRTASVYAVANKWHPPYP